MEWPLMRGQIIFTYFHFAADELLTKAVMKSELAAIAYETIKDSKGTLLAHADERVAGRMVFRKGQVPRKAIRGPWGSVGRRAQSDRPMSSFLGRIGANAAKVAAGLGVTILDIVSTACISRRCHAAQRDDLV